MWPRRCCEFCGEFRPVSPHGLCLQGQETRIKIILHWFSRLNVLPFNTRLLMPILKQPRLLVKHANRPAFVDLVPVQSRYWKK